MFSNPEIIFYICLALYKVLTWTQALVKRKWRTLMTVAGAETSKRRETMASLYLKQFGKSLDERQMAKVINAPQTSSPLYLKVLMEGAYLAPHTSFLTQVGELELRVHGSFEQLNATIERHLQARTVPELYNLFLVRGPIKSNCCTCLTRLLYQDRLEREHTVERVRSICLSLLLSRRGMADEELQETLGITRLDLSAVMLAMRESLTTRHGLQTFGQAFLREAVAKRYSNSVEITKQRLRLIRYWQGPQGRNFHFAHFIIMFYPIILAGMYGEST